MLREIAVDIHAVCFDDQLAELVAELEDPEEYLEPYDWPDWTDDHLWAPGADHVAYEPTAADWDDYRQWSEELERRRDFEQAMELLDCIEAREDADRFNDRDLQAAGLPVG
jgi:hypothetical protein